MVNVQTEPLKMKDDIMFKAFFSKKGNEKFLKDFLNSIFGKEIKIKKVIHDARLEQLAKHQKYGVLDLDVELESGEIVNIEMQMDDHHNMEKRTTFYASKKVEEQFAPKTKYSDLKNVIVIAILNFNFIKLPEYVTKTVRVADKHRDYEVNNNVTYYYIELEKFREQNPDMTLPVNQWLAFIDMEKGELLEMAKKENKLIKEAVEQYNILTGDAEVKRLAEIRMLSEMEEQAALEVAETKGAQKGLAEGEKIGFERGQKDEKIKTAKKLLKLKMPIEQIQEITGLSEAEIKELNSEG